MQVEKLKKDLQELLNFFYEKKIVLAKFKIELLTKAQEYLILTYRNETNNENEAYWEINYDDDHAAFIFCKNNLDDLASYVKRFLEGKSKNEIKE